MSFTNIVESRIDSFENAQQNIFIATPSPLLLLINFSPKLRNESNQDIGISRLIKKLMKYEKRNCLCPYNDLTLFRIKGGWEGAGSLYQFLPCNFYKFRN